jgi:tetratricopeptide (TPR) repeat protein
MLLRRIVVLLSAIGLCATQVAAQQTPNHSREPDGPPLGGASQGDPNTRAVAHYERGRAHYASGRYRSAIVELEAAIQLAPNLTDLYYDLGLVYERLGRLRAASRSYRMYLEHASDAAERERTQRILLRLDGAQREPLEFVWGGGPMGRADGLFWGLFVGWSAALVTGGVGLTLGILSTHRSAELLQAGMALEARNVSDLAAIELGVGVGFLTVAAGLGTSAGLLYAMRPARDPSATPLCFVILPGAASVLGSF